MANSELLQRFPYFGTCPEPMVADILANTQRHHFEKSRNVFLESDTCSVIAFLLSGKIRVYMLGNDGREITLYDVQAGETCILNVACILANSLYPARATVTQDGDGLVMPARAFRDIVDRYAEMRKFVYSGLGERLISMMKLVEEVAFRRLDERLRRYIDEKAVNGILHITHQKIANELGSSREMVSRLLGDLERKGLLSLSRNQIQIIQP
jgi:CRP/FNR family transcriptional regulator